MTDSISWGILFDINACRVFVYGLFSGSGILQRKYDRIGRL